MSLQYDLSRRNVFPDELPAVKNTGSTMLVRIPLLILLLSIIIGAGSLLVERFDAPILLSADPLQRAMDLMNEDWLVGVFSLSMLLVFYIIAKGRKQSV